MADEPQRRQSISGEMWAAGYAAKIAGDIMPNTCAYTETGAMQRWLGDHDPKRSDAAIREEFEQVTELLAGEAKPKIVAVMIMEWLP